MKTLYNLFIFCVLGFICSGLASQTNALVVENGIATYYADTNIGHKFPVPDSWNKILIKENVTITGSFYMGNRTKAIEIAGESRETSIIQGDGSRPTDDGIKGRSYSAIRCDSDPDVYVHDLKITKPMKFHIHGGFGNVTVERCNIIAGTHTYTTDGIHGGKGKTVVKDCYIDVYDDALYTSECKLVENTTILHNKNGGPFMTSWGGDVPVGHVCVIRNCTVISNYEGTDYNHGVASWAGKNSSGEEIITLKFEGTFTRLTNPGKKESTMYTIGRPGQPGLKNAIILVDGICPSKGDIDYRNSTNCEVRFINCEANNVFLIPGLIEAEDYDTAYGVQTEICSDTSGGENITDIHLGDWLEYPVYITEAGDYYLEYRVASPSESIAFDFKRGEQIIDSHDAHATGGTQTWRSDTAIVELEKGLQTLRIDAQSAGWKINWIKLSKKPILPNASDLKVRVNDYRSMKLSWNEAVSNETGFIIERSLAYQNDYVNMDTTPANVTFYTDTINLDEFTLYHYRIRTLYANDKSGASAAVLGRTAMATHAGLPNGWRSTSLGDTLVSNASTATFAADTFTLHAGGADFWTEIDRGMFVHQSATGDCEIRAQITDYTYTQSWVMAGLMIRESLDLGAKMASLLLIGDPGPIVRSRIETDGSVTQAIDKKPFNIPSWVRLKRVGNTFTGYTSADGIAWNLVRSVTVDMPNEVFIGMAANAHTNDSTGIWSYTDVEVSEPLPEYTIMASATSGGSILPSGTMLVLEGTDLTFDITPSNGFVIKDVAINGQSQGAVENVSIEDISNDISIQASFKNPLGVSEVKNTVALVYPNPTNHFLHIELQENASTVVELYSVTGTIIFSGVQTKHSAILDVSGFNKGLYYLKITQKDKVSVEQIIIE